MFATTVAGSLPKPSWLAEPDKLWPQWRQSGPELAAAKLRMREYYDWIQFHKPGAPRV